MRCYTTEKHIYKRYTKEFKKEADEAVGVSATTLHKWKANLEAQLNSGELSD